MSELNNVEFPDFVPAKVAVDAAAPVSETTGWVVFHRVSIERYIYGDVYWDAVFERGEVFSELVNALANASEVFDFSPLVRVFADKNEVHLAASVRTQIDEVFPVVLVIKNVSDDKIQRSFRRVDSL